VATVWTGYGRPAYGELRTAVAQRKRADALAPVTVLVPSNTAGVLVRRALAHGVGSHDGIAGLSVLTLDRLAERLAAPALAGSGRRPVTEPVLAAAWRRALAGEPGVFGPVADHPATVRALAAAHRELREVDDAGLDAMAGGGPIAEDLVRLHRRVCAGLRREWYDVTDLRRTATGGDEGSVIHFLPQDVPASARRFLDTIGDLHTIEGIDRELPVRAVVTASDADDEVRCMIRRVAATLRTIPAHRVAILYGATRPYARLLAEHLDAAGIRWNGRGVRPTIERRLARPLPALFAAAKNGWRRADVLAVFPNPPTSWERISRAAGVVGGDDWEVRLKAYAENRPYQADAADALRNAVGDLRARMAEGLALTTWPALAEWGRQTYTALVGDHDDRWPEDEQRAVAAVRRTLDALPGLDTVEPAADATLLDLTLDLELSGDLPRHGRIGDGVLVAPLPAAIGLDADEVFVLGLAEDLVPGRVHPDALLPDEIRALAGNQLPTTRDEVERRRRQVLAAFAAAPAVTASYPRGDLRRSRDRRPSRYLKGPETESRSYAAELAGTRELATEQEWRIRAAAAGALPPDRVVELAAEMRAARASEVLTRFDGDLSGLDLPDPTDGTPVSPTALEFWSRCPHAYFVQRLLGVNAVETPEEQLTIAPVELGNLYHDTLDRFFREQDARGAVPGGAARWSDAQRATLRHIAIEVAADLSVRGQTGHRLLWQQELAGVLAHLDRFLDQDQEVRAATGRHQVRSELVFGMRDQPPVPVPLADGRTLLMKGSADRIDLFPGGTIAVVDYKSGSARSFAGLGPDDPTRHGGKLQLPVYGLAARLALGAPSADVVAEYWFLHRDAGKRIELPITGGVEDAFVHAVTVIADGIGGGLFPLRPADEDGYAGFVPCPFCDPDGLGAGDQRERWSRKRNDPRLADYLALIEGTA
jgi:ATP-dependent helicase/nuclease subunit B